jgi:hypothetical protein
MERGVPVTEKERSANGEKHTGKCAVLKSEECVTVEHYREQLDHYVDLREHMSSGSIPEDHLPLGHQDYSPL